jgi:uracil-DNA glycosylase family 4
LGKNNGKELTDLEDRLEFFNEIGAGFFIKDLRAEEGEGVISAESGAPGSTLPPPASDIGTVHREILSCRKCPLAEGRTTAVPGEGNVKTELMFVGEGPGHDEDIQGRPFVGRAGQLLTKIIQAMTYDRSEVFITNIVKCRPPNNRVPHRDEIQVCTPYLLEQIRNIRPKVIVTLGKPAADFFIPDSQGGMTTIRGRFQDWNGIQVMPTFHPSYLIRNEGNKEIRRMVWDDMRKVMAFLGRK